MWFSRPARYTGGARLYDVVSGERPVYRAGRLAGIEQLRLRPGDWVLDVGCGTGLNLTFLLAAVGPGGGVVGVDASSAMLARARARVAKHEWHNVELLETDAAQLDVAPFAGSGSGVVDAALFTYSLSIIEDWREAYAQALARVRPGGRVAVVDMASPVGRWRVLSPLARLACVCGGADITRAPWQLVSQTAVACSHRVVRGGHVHISAGTRS